MMVEVQNLFMFLIGLMTTSLGHEESLNVDSYKFSQNNFFKNILITNLSLWTKSDIASEVECASECTGDSVCVSFFYNRATDVCTGHTVQFYGTEPTQEAEETKYYTTDVDKRDCADIKTNDPLSLDGVYIINPKDGQGAFQVYCDMTTDGGGWTVFQKRLDGSEDFFRTWAEYKEGFGNIAGNFWLGNDKIHRLTNARPSQLRIDMLDQADAVGFAKYSTFSIESEADKYRLSVSGFSGDRGDSLSALANGQKFTTKDQDNDIALINCAVKYYGGWWYKDCHYANLNGLYGSILFGEGLNWHTWHGHYVSLKHSEMKCKLNGHG